MKLDHQRLVFGPDGTDRDLAAILHRPLRNVLRGIGPDRRLRDFVLLRWIVQDDPRVEREQAIGRGDEGIDVDFRNRGCSITS